MTRRSIVLLLLATDFEVLAALQHNLVLEGALSALKAEHDLLGGLSLLVEDGLSLATEARLLAVITTLACALVLDRCARLPSDTVNETRMRTLCEDGGLAGLVLGDLVVGVLLALLAGAEGLTGLGNVDLRTSVNMRSTKTRPQGQRNMNERGKEGQTESHHCEAADNYAVTRMKAVFGAEIRPYPPTLRFRIFSASAQSQAHAFRRHQLFASPSVRATRLFNHEKEEASDRV